MLSELNANEFIEVYPRKVKELGAKGRRGRGGDGKGGRKEFTLTTLQVYSYNGR